MVPFSESRRQWLASHSLVASVLTVAFLMFVGRSHAERPPNVVFILADDLGFGDLGAYGQKKIRTPHVDRIAEEGMQFTAHYSGNAVCAPSRCVLMTGMHPGHAVVRNNVGMKDEAKGIPEGQFPLPDETVTLAELMQRAGYVTGAFGKWGLGGPTSSGAPLRQGITTFFGYNDQAVAHNFYPTYLWSNDQKVLLKNTPFSAHQKFPADADASDAANYTCYRGPDYSADLIAEKAVRFVNDNKDRPFFLFVPTTIPHLALQAPEDALAEYRGAFEEEPYLGDRGYLPHPTPRACYAAMVTRMDKHVGDLMQAIEKHGLDDDTIFVFTSDNGPLYDRLGGTDADFFQSCANLRGRKGSLYEGGIRTPLLVRWKGRIAAGTTSNHMSGFEDWMPTLLQLIGRTELTPQDIAGISLAPTLLGEAQAPRPFLYREFPGYGGQQSVRVGDWKAIRQKLGQVKNGKITTELYDLAADPTESRDMANENPKVLARLEQVMAEQHRPSHDFPLQAIDKRPRPAAAP